MKQLYVYDLETFNGFFLYKSYNLETFEFKSFVIHESENQIINLIIHLDNEVKGQVSFNGLGFDYPIIHYLKANYTKWVYDNLGGREIANLLYQRAQDIIECQNSEDNITKYKYYVQESDIIIPQLDLFKLLHLDNKSKRLGLKDLEVFLQMDNVQDLPFDHRVEPSLEQIEIISKYAENDVLATFKLYEFCKDRISLRRELSKKYRTNLMSKSDSSIGSTVLEMEYIKKTGISKKELKSIKGNKQLNFKIGDIISPLVRFNSPVLQDFFKTLCETNIKDFDELSVIFRGLRSIVAKGGLHSDNKPEIYEEDLDYSLIDLDFSSFYPGIMISEKLYPKQLGKEFLEVLKDLTNQRLLAKSNKDSVAADSLKITINSIYGKLGNDFSFTQDMRCMYSVTINGQLFLLMLCEMLTDLAGVTCFYQNTDGATFKVPNRSREDFYKVAHYFSEYINIPVEFTDYKKCIIRDVNNYLIVTKSGKIKYKGCFVQDVEYYQNPSFKIVRIALSDYFVKGIPFEQTIKSHRNILDFCGRFKTTSGWHSALRDIDYENKLVHNSLEEKIQFVKSEGWTEYYDSWIKESWIRDNKPYDRMAQSFKAAYESSIRSHSIPYLKTEKLQKTNRYYISTKGGSFMKIHEDGREQFIERDWQVAIFNHKIDKKWEDYKINYDYYIIEVRKIVRQIEKAQFSLF